MKEVISFREALLQEYIDVTDSSCKKVANQALSGILSGYDFEEEASIVFGYMASYLYQEDQEKFKQLFKPVAAAFNSIVAKEEKEGFHEMMRDQIHVVK
ncbi:hypothetical protein [Paenibacillus sp. P32E]|uniref:hypothetical protein n=1 Tax=Paenibacillus sp. P32E TaxID=1349434 RepID=UPI00093DB146|nr:hypothetical protein [Paenibacillus sp. P32E]OKP91379.1 hypothetical protein A3848_09750 [Paenibacillus sp. P32E]